MLLQKTQAAGGKRKRKERGEGLDCELLLGKMMSKEKKGARALYINLWEGVRSVKKKASGQ